MGGRGDRPTVENRWWVDQGKDSKGAPLERPPAQFGGRFFRTGAGFDQDRAQRRLTDLNLKWFDEADAPIGGWAVIRSATHEGAQSRSQRGARGPDRFPEGRLERVKAGVPVPPDGRGVLIDSGNALRAIITGQRIGERLVEVRLGEDNSFDAWVQGEWVREAFFRNFDDALRRVPALVREYLLTDRAASRL